MATGKSPRSPDAVLKELEKIATSEDILHIEQRRYFVKTKDSDAAMNAAMELTREGTWVVNLHESGHFFSGKKEPILELVIEKREK